MPYEQRGAGWAKLVGLSTAHYFMAGRSLCRKGYDLYLYTKDNSTAYWHDKCETCRAKLDKMTKPEGS
jgi:hypothetical protein